MSPLAVVSAQLLTSPAALLFLQAWRRPRLGGLLLIILMILGIIYLTKKIIAK